MARILVVDDDPVFQTRMALLLKRLGHQCLSAASFGEGLARAREQAAEVVFLDVYLPDSSGLDGIEHFRALPLEPEVIVVTGRCDPDSAERAINHGAWYYLEKSGDPGNLVLTLKRCLASRDALREAGRRLVLERDAIIGSSQALKKSLALLGQAANSRENVCITGETGTGKELFARALHDNSLRKGQPFVVVDCTNIPAPLAESILFGHVRGAFTDARSDREGLVALANGGTLFLDEVGDMPPALQRSLLRVIQENRFRPLGGKHERSSDFRVVAVTNRDLQARIEDGQFRDDLYYRLAQRHIHLPPLRLRLDDVPLLAAHYVARTCSAQEIDVKGLSTEYLESLTRHDWPGNVRQLISTITLSIANAGDDPVLTPHHLPTEHKARYLREQHRASPPGHVPAGDELLQAASLTQSLAGQPFPTLRQFRDVLWARLEAAYLDRLWTLADGNVPAAMELADVSRARIYQLLRKYRPAGRDGAGPSD
jgi:two-component system NtrC family response regulator